MHPILFQAGPVTIYTYGALLAVGVIFAIWFASHDAPRFGLAPIRVWNLGIYGILLALLSSKLWLILSSWDYYVANPREILSAATLQSGGTFYGGLIGGIIWTIFYTRHEKMPLLTTLDAASAPVALGHAIGRVGCFAAGCCFGKPTSLPWAVTFTSEVAARISGTPLHVAVHPTQLYEAAAETANFAILYWIGRRSHVSGQVVGAYLAFYGMERGLLEFIRDDPGRTLLFRNAISLMQVVSIALLIGGMWLWFRARPRRAPQPASAQ
jgi:phosphatidylglycerol---prolipoprotein diacylglyceryl transferase